MTFPKRCKEQFHLHLRIARFVLESNAEFCTANQKTSVGSHDLQSNDLQFAIRIANHNRTQVAPFWSTKGLSFSVPGKLS